MNENPSRTPEEIPAHGGGRIPVGHLALLFAAALVFHCLGTWSLPLIDRDEPRFSEASREMLQRRDFVVPYFNNSERFDKPALIYWFQCAGYTVFGDNKFAVRFPSAVFAAALAVALAVWGARLFDPATGWRAAIIFSTAFQTLIHARAAVADMAMVFFVLLAAWAGWEWRRAAASNGEAGREWKMALLLALALGLGFLAKGPIAWMPLGMLWWSGLPRAVAPRRVAVQWVVVILGSIAVVALWGIPALVRTHGAFAQVGLGKHVVARSVAPLEGHGSEGLGFYLLSLPFYFLAIFGTFLPWSVWLPSTIRHAWRRAAERGSIERYLLVGTLLCFGIFTLVRTKLPHYTLPAFPFLALLMAVWWRDAARPAGIFRRVTVIGVCFWVFIFLVGFPIAARQFVAEALYDQAAPLLRKEMSSAAVEYDEPSLVWLLRQRIGGFHTKVKDSKIDEWFAEPGPRVAIMPEPTYQKVRGGLDPMWPVFHSAGWHPVKGKYLRLVLVVKQ